MSAGDRTLEGQFPMLTFAVVALVTCTVTSLFAYLRYRAYLDLAKHVSDTRGVAGLRALSAIAKPDARVSTDSHLDAKIAKSVEGSEVNPSG